MSKPRVSLFRCILWGYSFTSCVAFFFVVGAPTFVGVEPIDIPDLDVRMHEVTECLNLPPREVRTYRAIGIRRRFLQVFVAAYADPSPFIGKPAIVFMHDEPPPWLVRHELIHVVRGKPGHPDNAFRCEFPDDVYPFNMEDDKWKR